MEASTVKFPKSNGDSTDHKLFLIEVNNIEKQLWTLIQSKGILHPNVSELYEKSGFIYEQIFISNLQQEDLQEAEFSLWKLHYKHIDEFRKVLKTDELGIHMKAFKLFLSKATEFYQNLISNFKEPEQDKSRFLCHRFYICLGDLERYKEQYLKTHQHPNWSTAATYYLEAAKSCPDSGNPHNQLAVLATYIGDEFLALYHCVRSLAVKEPFPGAWNNLLLLFEKNRSSPLQSLCSDAQFNLLNPSKRYDHHLSKAVAGTDLWPLIVRTVGFLFIKFSFDEFVSSFASTMRELDAAFAADDRNLEAMLESYQIMDTSRKGPYRILQLVAVFIFIFHNIAELNGSDNGKKDVKLTNLALTMVFTVMGRVVERCLKTSSLDSCPLLPALLVFLDYLPYLLHKAEDEEFRFDEKSEIAISYFLCKLVDFLNRLKTKGENFSSKIMVGLWEDHELRSMTPLAPVQVVLDFSSDLDLRESFDRGKDIRLQRIINSAIKITKGSQKWLFFDKQRTHFYTKSGEMQPVEEEEVILLKPLVRCQSAPICSSSIATKPLSPNNTNESLRRTLSLKVNDSPKDMDQQHLNQDKGGVSGRPPSLSAWVVKEGLNKPNVLLTPIDETVPLTSFDSLSISSSASSYSPPTPSAPLLPEDASWFQNDQPPFVGISSSEWLRRYRESRNLGTAYSYQAQGTNNLRNFLAHGSSKLSLLARYGTPDDQIYMEDNRLGNGQQNSTKAYGLSDDPGPFLRYLREKEWLNENGKRLGGPSHTYMNN